MQSRAQAMMRGDAVDFTRLSLTGGTTRCILPAYSPPLTLTQLAEISFQKVRFLFRQAGVIQPAVDLLAELFCHRIWCMAPLG